MKNGIKYDFTLLDAVVKGVDMEVMVFYAVTYGDVDVVGVYCNDGRVDISGRNLLRELRVGELDSIQQAVVERALEV